MIEIRQWAQTVALAQRPWLILGKGPSFALRHEFDLQQYNLLSLNHTVRELRVDVAHIIDIDVVEACAPALAQNCRYLLMPRRPHVRCAPGAKLLEDYVRDIPVLRELNKTNRLVWYNLSSSAAVGDSPVVGVRWFSAEAALNILALLGSKCVRTLGVDGGRGYSRDFADLEKQTMLANGHETFHNQFEEIESIVRKHGIDYAPLVEPMRVFVGTDESQRVAARVLEHSIRKHASRPVTVHPMFDLKVPLPKDRANRPRTGFSFHRFAIPKLCGYRGRALYIDADMQVFADLAELWRIPFGNHKVLCTNQPDTPELWKGNRDHFHPGRQMSVMLLDCSRLDWDVAKIVDDLDQKRYDYRDLMFNLCVVQPDEIADDIPPEWNCLEWYDAQRTKLLHYTVVPTQPWKNDENPLASIWMAEFREALAAGAVSPTEIWRGVMAGHLKRSLAEGLPNNVPRPKMLDRFAGVWQRRLAQHAKQSLRQLKRSILG